MEGARKFVDPFELEIKATAKNLEALGAINLAAIFVALASDTGRLEDKENIKTLIYMQKPLSVFVMPSAEYGAFRRDAENCRVVQSAIFDSRSPEEMSVIFKSEDLSRIKQIFDDASYDTSGIILEKPEKNQNARAPQGHTSGERGHGLNPRPMMRSMMTKKPSVRAAIRSHREIIDIGASQKQPPPKEQQSWRELLENNLVGG